jgi:hypothetical protein
MDFAGDTEHEHVYRALRAMVGKGGSAVDESGIDGLWRFVQAKAIASVTRKGELVALQAFPDHATELLPYYERLLLLTPDLDDTEEDRQAAALEAYARQIAGDLPDVGASLQRIDARFTILPSDPELSLTTRLGRAFDDLEQAEPYVPGSEDANNSGRRSTAFPNYSSEFTAVVLLELGDGVAPSSTERRSLATAKRLLDDLLPGHNDAVLITHSGFTLGVSLLDYTGLS